jgi:hypothetical protein
MSMEHAIACLERELAVLANNFAVQADADAQGKDRDDEQQNLRWRQMEGIRRGIASLRHARQSQMPQEAYRAAIDQFAQGRVGYAVGEIG